MFTKCCSSQMSLKTLAHHPPLHVLSVQVMVSRTLLGSSGILANGLSLSIGSFDGLHPMVSFT